MRYIDDDAVTRSAPATFDTKLDANAWLADYLRGEAVLETRPTFRLRDYTDAWLAGRELRPATRSQYARYLKNAILLTFGDTLLGNISPARVRAWYDQLDPAEPTRRRRVYGVFHAVMGRLVGAQLSRRGGKKVVEWVPIAVHWQLRKADGQRWFLARQEPPKPAARLALPGDAASLRVVESATTGAAYVHDPHAGTLTAVVEVASPAFALLSADTQERRVSAWGRVLAMPAGRDRR